MGGDHMKRRLSQAEAWRVILICLAGSCNLSANSSAAAESFVKFHLPHTKQVSVSSINASNVAVGFMVRDDNSLIGFIRGADGAITALRVNHQPTNAVSINSHGAMTGVYGIGGPFHGFIRSPDGTIATFDAPGAGTQTGQGTGPTSINDSGSITGYYIDSANAFHGFVRTPDGTIKSFDAGANTIPRGINSDGLITGDYYTDTHHAFLRQADESIETIDPPGSLDTTDAGINNNGEVVGAFNDAAGNVRYVQRAEFDQDR